MLIDQCQFQSTLKTILTLGNFDSFFRYIKIMQVKKKIITFSSNFDLENGQAVVTRRVVQHVWPTVGESVNCIYNSGFNISGYNLV